MLTWAAELSVAFRPVYHSSHRYSQIYLALVQSIHYRAFPLLDNVTKSHEA